MSVRSETATRTTNSRLRRAVAAGVVGQAVNLVARFALTPLLIHALGLAGFGFWALAFLVIGLLGLQRTGFVAGAVPILAQQLSRRRHDAIVALLRTAATAGLLLALVLGGSVWLLSPAIVSMFGVPTDQAADATGALRIVLLTTSISLVFGGWQTLLEARQRIGLVRAIETIANLLEIAVISALIANQQLTLFTLAAAMVVRQLLPLPVFALVTARQTPWARVRPGRIDRQSLRQLWRNGAPMQLLGVVHVGIAGIDRLAVGHLLGLSATGTLEVGRKLVQVVANFVGQGFAPLVPVAADLWERDRPHLIQLVQQTTYVMTLVSALPLAITALAAPEVLTVWLGACSPPMPMVLRALCIGTLIHLATGPATHVLRGRQQPGAEMRFSLIWLSTVAVTVPLAAATSGVVAAAVAASLSQAFVNLALLWRSAERLGMRSSQLLACLLRPAAIAGLCAYIAWQTVSVPDVGRFEQGTRLLVAGLLAATLAAVLAVATNGDLRQRLPKRTAHWSRTKESLS